MRALVLFCNDVGSRSNPPRARRFPVCTLLLKTERRCVTFMNCESLGRLPIWTNELLFAKQKHSMPSYRCFMGTKTNSSLSQWSRGLSHRSTAARLLRLWVRIPPGAWLSVCCEWCVLWDRSLCDELITRPEEFYRLLCVVVCDLETSWMRRPWPVLGRSATKKVLIVFCRLLAMFVSLIVNSLVNGRSFIPGVPIYDLQVSVFDLRSK
jgi:hypothetical protein